MLLNSFFVNFFQNLKQFFLDFLHRKTFCSLVHEHRVLIRIIFKNKVIVTDLFSHNLLHFTQVFNTHFLNRLLSKLRTDPVSFLIHPLRVLFDEFLDFRQNLVTGIFLCLSFDSLKNLLMKIGLLLF